MKNRIRQIQESKQMTQREFAEVLGISPSSLSSIYNGHTSPTNNHVQAIHRRFPEISITWLMFGEGEMMDSENTADRPTNDTVAPPTEKAAPAPSQEPAVEGVENAAPGQVVVREIVKYTDKPQRKITEIRVFYDDGTFDTFSGKRE